MHDGDIHMYRECRQGVLLEWTNRLDSAGSRIEWRISTDHQGWVCRYGAVHNQGIVMGSQHIAGPADEKALLQQLRQQAFREVSAPPDHNAPAHSLAA